MVSTGCTDSGDSELCLHACMISVKKTCHSYNNDSELSK